MKPPSGFGLQDRFYVLKVLRRDRVPISSKRLRSAVGAIERTANAPALFARLSFNALQDRGLALLETGSTKVMRGFAVAHRFLQRVHHAPGKGGRKLVALLLSVPVFHASNLAFQLAYAINQRRLRRLYGKQFIL